MQVMFLRGHADEPEIHLPNLTFPPSPCRLLFALYGITVTNKSIVYFFGFAPQCHPRLFVFALLIIASHFLHFIYCTASFIRIIKVYLAHPYEAVMPGQFVHT